MPTIEQRGHLGLSSSGGGICSAGGQLAQTLDGLLRGVAQLLIERDGRPLAAGDIVEDALLATIVVRAQEHILDAELDPLRLAGAARHMRTLAALVVDRGHIARRRPR